MIALAMMVPSGCTEEKPSQRLAFRDKSASLPALDAYSDFGVMWGDFNNDERSDLIFMGHGLGPHMLAQDAGHTFAHVTDRSGIRMGDWEYQNQRDRHGAACADFDNDGNLDIYISHGARWGETLGIKYDELLKGNGDFSFSDVSRSAASLNQFGRGRGHLV